MKFTDSSTQAVIKRLVKLTGGPVLTDEWSRNGRKYRVDLVEIEYTLKGGEWVVGWWTSVGFVGTVLKKDGTDSANTAYRHPAHSWPRSAAVHPWLSKIVEEFRPVGALILPTGEWTVVLDGEDLA